VTDSSNISMQVISWPNAINYLINNVPPARAIGRLRPDGNARAGCRNIFLPHVFLIRGDGLDAPPPPRMREGR
jgi:hypothetical protein